MPLSQRRDNVTHLQLTCAEFVAVCWTVTAMSFMFLVLRVISRLRGSRRLFFDDYLLIFGWILVMLRTALWQWAAVEMFQSLDSMLSTAASNSLSHDESITRYIRVQAIGLLFYYTTLLAAKLSIIFFFRRLGRNARRQKRIWWPVLLVSLATYIVSISYFPYACLVGSGYDQYVVCHPTAFHGLGTRMIAVNTGLDILSDLFIMTLPLALVWGLRLKFKKKLAFMGLFSLSLITIAVAILRAYFLCVSRVGVDQDLNPLTVVMWGAIQTSLAVIIVSLMAFPQLFAAAKKTQPTWPRQPPFYNGLGERVGGARRDKINVYDLTLVTTTDETNRSSRAENIMEEVDDRSEEQAQVGEASSGRVGLGSGHRSD